MGKAKASSSSATMSAHRASRKPSMAMITDGDKPSDFLSAVSAPGAAKKRQLQYEQIVGSTKLTCSAFMANYAKNRAPVPINDKKRVKVQCTKPDDSDYVPGSYASFDREDYILMQAPKDTGSVIDFWRVVWQDGCKLLVSVTPTEELSEDGGERSCYPYWPREDGKVITLSDGRFVIKCVKKNEGKNFVSYDLSLKSTEEDGAMPDTAATKSTSKDEDDGEKNEKEKDRQICLLHYENWPADKWPDIDSVANFVQTLSKKEIQVIRKATDNYVPPVMLQGFEAIGRTCVIWVNTILYKDMEKRDGCDVDDLIRRISRARPGALHSRVHFTTTYAVAFRLASLSGWLTSEEARSKIKEIKESMEKEMKA